MLEKMTDESLLSGVELLLATMVDEAKAARRTEIDPKTGKQKIIETVSFAERLKLAATCTSFLQAKAGLLEGQTPPAKSPFEEMRDEYDEASGGADTGQVAKKKVGRPKGSRKQPAPAGDDDQAAAGDDAGIGRAGLPAGTVFDPLAADPGARYTNGGQHFSGRADGDDAGHC